MLSILVSTYILSVRGAMPEKRGVHIRDGAVERGLWRRALRSKQAVHDGSQLFQRQQGGDAWCCVERVE